MTREGGGQGRHRGGPGIWGGDRGRRVDGTTGMGERLTGEAESKEEISGRNRGRGEGNRGDGRGRWTGRGAWGGGRAGEQGKHKGKEGEGMQGQGEESR